MTSTDGRVHRVAISYVDDSENSTIGSHGDTERSHCAALKPSRDVFKVVGRGFSLSCARYAESLVLLCLPLARRKQRDGSITAGESSELRLGHLMCNTSNSSLENSVVVVSGMRWSCHGFHNAGNKQT